MANIVLTTKTLLDTNVSSNTGWYYVDWRYEGAQQRRIVASKDANDEIHVDALIDDTSDKDPSGIAVTAAVTAAVSGATSLDVFIEGPYSAFRIRKINANATARVVGIL
jgi:hypothetical protein